MNDSLEQLVLEAQEKKLFSSCNLLECATCTSLKEALREQITRAYAVGVEAAIEVVKSNQKGAFETDGGHEAWYVDSLAEALKELTPHSPASPVGEGKMI